MTELSAIRFVVFDFDGVFTDNRVWTNERGEEGVWIQSARADRTPVLVADGDFVAWSPA